MPIEVLEILKLTIGVLIIIIPGYFFSFLFSKKLKFFERVVFGFVLSLGIIVSILYLNNVIFNFLMTRNSVLLIFAFYFMYIIFISLENRRLI